jgi:glycerol uptake facilitator protein
MSRFPLTYELAAEFFGTMMILLFGSGVVAMTLLFSTGAPSEVSMGGYTNITIAWGLGVTFGVYVSGRISGGHLNPAVTLALALFRGFPWSKVAPYCLAQTAGAFSAAALVFLN